MGIKYLTAIKPTLRARTANSTRAIFFSITQTLLAARAVELHFLYDRLIVSTRTRDHVSYSDILGALYSPGLALMLKSEANGLLVLYARGPAVKPACPNMIYPSPWVTPILPALNETPKTKP
jgi:hypothetical protein